jgi:predicted MFS family arabinose efflux permease
MNSFELRSALSLAGIFALRMLGLFLILPIFSLHARGLPGGDDATLVGLALGIYGMVQAFFHIPLGLLSDRIGRRAVVVGGLVMFVIGAEIAASHDDLTWIIVGRAIQGAGAVSAAVTAWLADLTREEIRARAMALIGGSIALTFALSLVLAAPLHKAFGLTGIFNLMAILGAIAIFVTLKVVPNDPEGVAKRVNSSNWREILARPELLRLNFGVLVLHASQVAMFMVVPRLLDSAGLPLDRHWSIYLPVVLISFLIMAPLLMRAEKQGKIRVLMITAIVIMMISQAYFSLILGLQLKGTYFLAFGLLTFFVGFNLLEALQPSLVSRLAGDFKGTALGIYNTTQSLGLFVGALAGGWLISHWGADSIFHVDIVLIGAWLIIAWSMSEVPGRQKSV